VDNVIANGSTLEFAHRNPEKRPLGFAIHEFTIEDLGGRGPMRFQIALLNPQPPGEVRATGRLGPWRANQVSQTPIAGSYSFQRADLGVFKGIAGILSSEGKFQGMLREMEVQGATLTPDFEVTRSGHRFRLATKFRAAVSGTNGDVVLRDVSAHFLNTTVNSAGSIEGHAGEKGKTASLELAVRDDRRVAARCRRFGRRGRRLRCGSGWGGRLRCGSRRHQHGARRGGQEKTGLDQCAPTLPVARHDGKRHKHQMLGLCSGGEKA